MLTNVTPLSVAKRSTNWSSDEDACLVKLVERLGAQKWGNIALEMENRNGKQCRERWHNHLDPSIKKEPWSVEEEITLVKVFLCTFRMKIVKLKLLRLPV